MILDPRVLLRTRRILCEYNSSACSREGRLVAVDGGATAQYTYDAEGKRVEKVAGSTTIDYLYSLDGHVIAEALRGGGWNAGYVYPGGQLVALYESGTTYFVHPDHLGSTRLMTDMSGSVCESNDFLPFGESNCTSGSCSTTHEIAGHRHRVRRRVRRAR